MSFARRKKGKNEVRANEWKLARESKKKKTKKKELKVKCYNFEQ